jgi:hypothetical protein
MGAKLTADMKRVVVEQRLAFVATVCPEEHQSLAQGHNFLTTDHRSVLALAPSDGLLFHNQIREELRPSAQNFAFRIQQPVSHSS